MWHLNGLPNDRHNPGRQRKGHKLVGFCSRKWVVEGKLRLGGRKRVTTAEGGWGTKALRRRVSFSLTVGLKRMWVCERVHCDFKRASCVNRHSLSPV